MRPPSPRTFSGDPRRQPVIELTNSVECDRPNLLVHFGIDAKQHQPFQHQTVRRTLYFAFDIRALS
jgi:hypothetical protein